MSNHLVQIGELIPIKGIFFRVEQATGQNLGYPEILVLRPHSLTMNSIKRANKESRRKNGREVRRLRG